jgi:hypothetical protein
MSCGLMVRAVGVEVDGHDRDDPAGAGEGDAGARDQLGDQKVRQLLAGHGLVQSQPFGEPPLRVDRRDVRVRALAGAGCPICRSPALWSQMNGQATEHEEEMKEKHPEGVPSLLASLYCHEEPSWRCTRRTVYVGRSAFIRAGFAHPTPVLRDRRLLLLTSRP